jgi:tRNA pseudouridine38-40 synthase
MPSSLSRILKLTLAYDGTGFSGWQRQGRLRTVQAELETALAAIEGAPVAVAGAGRTDAGVHAVGQVASAHVTGTHDTDTYQRALNARLPDDVRVIAVEDAAPGFHARFSPSIKTYRYTIWNSRTPPALATRLAWHVPVALDLDAMRAAAAFVVGTHDFTAFRARGSHVRSSVRSITRSVIDARLVSPGWPVVEAAPEAGGISLIAYEVAGAGFVRQMVRALAGTLVEIGKGHRAPKEMARLLEGRGRQDAGPAAPACGLALCEVRYDAMVEVGT